MADIKYLVTALLAIPMILLLSLSVFQGMARNSRVNFEATVTNETIKSAGSASDAWFTTTYAMKPNGTVALANSTGVGWEAYTNYTVDPDYAIDQSRVHLGSDLNATNVVVMNYTGYTGTGYESYAKVYDQTISGYNLGSLTPYIIIALAIVTTIIGVFGVTKLL